MCTLTYIPNQNGEHIITSSRDETPEKPAINPQVRYNHPYWLTYPTDIRGGGSWIAYRKKNQQTAVLLNGAFEAHKHQPPYGHSRGLIVLKSFRFLTLQSLANQYTLKNIEPFTLVRFSPNNSIEELRWDGRTTQITYYNESKPRIWSSASLYNEQMQQKRADWFYNIFRDTPEPDANIMWEFHHKGGEKLAPKSYQICMSRSKVKTLSIMQIMYNESNIQQRYKNLFTE